MKSHHFVAAAGAAHQSETTSRQLEKGAQNFHNGGGGRSVGERGAHRDQHRAVFGSNNRAPLVFGRHAGRDERALLVFAPRDFAGRDFTGCARQSTEFLGTLGGGQHRVHHDAAKRAVFEGVQSGDGGAARRRDPIFENAGMFAGFQQHFGRT